MRDGIQDTDFDRDETHINNQDSEPTPVAHFDTAKPRLSFLGKGKKYSGSKATNMVAPYNPSLLDDNDFDMKKLAKRYDDEICNDFSRANDLSGEENIGIGDDDLDGGPGGKDIFFDDEDLNG